MSQWDPRDSRVLALTNKRGPLETATPNVDREADRARVERDTFYMRYNIDDILEKLLSGMSRESDRWIQHVSTFLS